MTRTEIIEKIRRTIVTSLELEDMTSDAIPLDEPLFGEGLGLDSIDALELGMAIKKAFGVKFSEDPAENKRIFRSVSTLADWIARQQA